MKTSVLFVIPALVLAIHSAPLRAQYNPPPPPEEQQQGQMNQPPAGAADQGGPAPGDQGAPPAPDQGPPPGADQNGAPPMDPNAPTDQYGAPADQGAPPDQDSDQQGGDANFQTFYDNLSSQGNWVQTDNYGYVWQPNEDDPDWAPYTDGHWVYTDEGWTWVAADSEPWGWATYHYGRWVNLDGTGWVWVPGYTWAPAWVSWRYGGGYCGWAPLPPATFVGIDFGGDGYGFHIGGDCDTAYGIGPGYYHFVPVGYIGARDYRHYYVDPHNNFTIINNTRNVTNIVVNSQAGAGRFGRVRAGGPSFAAVNAQAQTPVQRMTLARSSQMGNARLSGNRLAVFAPHVAAAAATGSFRPRSVAGNLATVRVNNGTNISEPLAVNARVRPSGPTGAQVQAAQVAAARASTAHVATVNTRPTQALTQPITRLQPHEARSYTAGANASPAPTVHHTSANAGVRPENAFTGETAAPETAARSSYETGTSASPAVHHYDADAAPATTHASDVPHSAPEEHHETAPVEHQEAAAPREDFHPQAEQPHFNAPPVQHQEVRPQIQQQQHAAVAPAKHPAADAHHAGDKKDDDKK